MRVNNREMLYCGLLARELQPQALREIGHPLAMWSRGGEKKRKKPQEIETARAATWLCGGSVERSFSPGWMPLNVLTWGTGRPDTQGAGINQDNRTINIARRDRTDPRRTRIADACRLCSRMCTLGARKCFVVGSLFEILPMACYFGIWFYISIIIFYV